MNVDIEINNQYPNQYQWLLMNCRCFANVQLLTNERCGEGYAKHRFMVYTTDMNNPAVPTERRGMNFVSVHQMVTSISNGGVVYPLMTAFT